MGLSPSLPILSYPSSAPVAASGEPAAKKTPYSAPINLVDPITRKQLNLADPFKDRLLRLNNRERMQLGLKTAFVTLPKNIYQGLKGDPNYSFADFLNISKAPYYLGGAFLAASFAAGRARLNFARQSVGVALYFLGVLSANRLIDALYKFRVGIDLNLRYYKSATGDIEKVLASTDFPRFDLLEKTDYEQLAQKMKLPPDLADPKKEVHDQLREVISTARADKLILGNMLAAFGAGYLAQTDAWARLTGPFRGTKLALQEGNPVARVKNTALSLWGHTERAVQEQVLGYAGELNSKQRLGFLGGVGALAMATVAHVWWTTRSKQYEAALPESPNMEHTPTDSFSTGGLR